MAKRYTAEEIKQKNFKRITGMNQKEYGEKVARDQLAKQKTFEIPTTEAPNYETASPDYKFTAEKPIKQNYVRDILSNPHTGSPWDANNAVYDMDKYNEDLAKYNTAVSEANKRAISDITKKDQQGEAVKGLPSLTQQNMINEMKPHIETDSFQRMKNIVAAEREKNPEAFEKAVAKGRSEAEKHDYYNTMSGDEQTELAYLIGSGNEINLEAYLKSGESVLKQKEADRNALAVKKKAEQNPAFGVAANLAGGIVSPTSYIGEVVNQGAGLFTGVNEPLPEYSKWNAAARIEKSSREGLTEGKSETPAFLINVGLSIGQNLVRLPLSIFGGGTGEVLSLVSMASSAAGQTVYEAVQRGATGGQALLLGTVAGGVEYLTEKISLDKLLTLGKDSVRIFSKEAAQGIVRQMVSEGGEEMISEVANIIADSLIMGDKSELISMYNSYLESGMSKKDAEANTIWHTVLNIGLAGLGGALSGGVLGGGGIVVGSTVNNISEGNNTGNVKQLISKAASMPEDSTAYKLSQRAKKKLDDGKRFNKYELGQLSNEIKIAEAEKIRAAKIEAEAKAKESTNTEAENKVAPTVETAETPIKTESNSTDKSETANGWVFEEKKEALPDSAKASERAAMFGANGQKGYITAVESIRKENPSADIESFTKAFEKAYIAGYSRTSESKYTSDPYLYKAYMNGYNDSKLDYSSDVKYIDTVGVTRAGENKGLVENELSSKLSNRAFSFWNKLAKDLDVKIEIVNELEGNKALAGSYRDGYIRINANSDKPINSLMAHEVVHRIKEISPEAYSTLKKQVVSALGESVVDEVQRIPLKYASVGEDISSVAKAEEEVVAEYTERLFGEEATAEKFIKENQSIAKRILEAINGFIEKIRKAFGKGSTKELSDLEKLASSWDSAIKTATKEVKTAKTTTESRTESYAVNKAVEEMSETELRQKVSELEEQNKNLSKIAYEGATVPGIDKVTKFSNELLKKYSSGYDSSKLASHINERLIEIDTGFDKNGKPLQSWELERNLKNTLRPMIDEAVEVDRERYEELADVRKNLRATKLRIRRIDSLDFGSAEDYNAFRMSNFGRVASLKVVDDNTDNIDSVYFSLNDKYGEELFPSDITAASDQLQIIMGIYDLAQVTERNVHEGMEDLALNNAVDDVWDFYMEHRHSPEGDTVADMRNREILKQRELRSYQNKQAQKMFVALQKDSREYKNSLKKEYEEKSKALNEQKIQQDKQAQKTFVKLQEDARQYRKWLENKLTENSKKYKEQVDKETAETLKQSKEKLRESFKANAKIMRENFYERQRIIKENKTKTPVVKSFEGVSRHLLKVGHKMLTTEMLGYLEDKTVGKMRAYTQDDESVKTIEVLEHFVRKLISESSNTTWSDDVEERIKAIENKDREFYIDLHPHGVDGILDQIDFIARVLRDISMNKEMNFAKMAENAVRDMNNAISDEEVDKFKSKGIGISLRENLMTMRTFLRYIGGYSDGVFDEIADMLETSENKSRLIRRDLKDMFSSLVSDERYKEFKTKRIVLKAGQDFTTRQPNVSEITITPDMLVALVKHSQNEQNMNHIEPNDSKNGIQIPSVDKIIKGDTDSAWNNKPIVNFTKEQISNLAKKYLTKYDKDFLSTYSEFADVVSKKLLNEASMDAYGTIVAPVENYMHIRLVPGFKGSQTAQLFGEDKEAKKISGSGSLKARATKATEPILLEPLSLAIEDQIELVSEYAGKAGTDQRIRKMTKTRVSHDGNEVTFDNTLRNRWGSFGSKNWNNIMFDFNGNSRSDYNTFAKLRSNYAIARLGLNFKSIAVQPTAAITALAELGYDSGFGKIEGKKLTLEDLAPYTARATDRAEGLINAELAERYGAKAGFDKATQWTMRWITSHDVIAVKQIIPMAQRYVEHHYPDIVVDSPQYVKTVAEEFEKAINRTQTGATAMLRPELYRGNNYLLKLVNFMGSESLKNGNMIIDARRNVKAKEKRYKANPTEANREALAGAKLEYHRKLNAVRLTNLASTLIGAVIAAVFQGKWEKYVDEDGELGLSDLGKASMQIVSDYVDSMLSSFFFHDKVWAIAEGVIKGESPDFRYELNQSIPELEAVYGAVEDVYRIYDAVIDYNSEMSDKNAEKLLSLVGHAANTAAGSIATLFGIPTENVFKEAFGLAETVSKFSNTSEGVLAQYELLKMQQSVYKSSNKGKVYDLLYQAYLLDDRTAYRNIRRDLLEKGYTHQALDSAIEKRRKEDREKQRKK